MGQPTSFFRSPRCAVGCATLTLALLVPADAASLRVRVVDEGNARPLVEAQVVIGNRAFTADETGGIAADDLPPGRYSVVVTAAGHRTLNTTLTIGDGENWPTPFALAAEIVQLDRVVVADRASEAAANFGDRTSAAGLVESITGRALDRPAAQVATDLIKDTAGVSVTRGADGSTNVSMRGLDSRFVRVTVDGQRQGGRGNPLDSVPPEIVKSLQVAKSLTPDLDADALGGAINVTTQSSENIKAAYAQGRHQLTFAPIENRPGIRNSFTQGLPVHWLGPKSAGGLIATVNFDDQYRRRENNETDDDWPSILSPGPAPFTGQLIPAYTLVRLEITEEHRRRYGGLLNADARLGDLTLFLRSNLARDTSVRSRRRMRFDVAEGRALELTPARGLFSGVHLERREQEQTTERDSGSFSFGGDVRRPDSKLDAALGLVLTRDRDPHTLDTVFKSDRTFRASYDLGADPFRPTYAFVDETNPADAASPFDPTRYRFDSFSRARTETRDREISGRVNFQRELGSVPGESFVKFGVKFQQRHRTADSDRQIFDASSAPLSMVGLVRSADFTTVDGIYRFGPIPSTAAVAALLAASPGFFQTDAFETAIANASTDYRVTESIWAGYGMAQWKLDRWTVLGGVRLEGTDVQGDANRLGFSVAGALQSVSSVAAGSSYLHVLPGLHVRLDAAPGLIVRGSVTRSLSRPSYSDILPTQQFNFVDRRVQSGNPTLRPYESINYDLSADLYRESLGLFSAAVFAKDISRFIVESQQSVNLFPFGPYLERRRINGGRAHVVGLETSWKGNAVPLAVAGVKFTPALSYTLLRSGADLPDRPGESVPLPSQANHQISTAAQFVRGAAAMELTARYRGQTLESVVSPGRDLLRRAGWDFELGFTYQLSKAMRFQFAAANLSNRPTQDYTGDRTRLKEVEVNGPEFSLSVQWKK
jgi:TonB-dependent receptor